MQRPRILIVSHEFSLSGAPIALLKLATGLADRFELRVVAPFDGPLRDQLLARQINACVVPGLLRDPRLIYSLMQCYDILLANTILTHACIPTARVSGKPSVWYLHEAHAFSNYLKLCPPAVSALEEPSVVVVPCRFSQQLYLPWRSGPIEVVPYGVEFREQPPTTSAETIRVLQLGAFHPRKGQDLALAAMRVLKNERITLSVVGKIDHQDFHRYVLNEFSDVSNVSYRTEVPMEQTAAVISDCDMLIVPSRDEVTPMVILEAMAAAKPVIAACTGGIGEMIREGETGFLFKREDVSQLAQVIAKVGGDAALRREVGVKAQEYVRDRRSLQQYSDGFATLFTQLARSDGA